MEKELLNMSFEPDYDADEELGPQDLKLISDHNIRGSRISIVQKQIQVVEFERHNGGAVVLGCTFHAAQGLRFSQARLVLTVKRPHDTQVIDFAPKEVKDGDAVKFEISRSGKVGVAKSPFSYEGNQSQKLEYTHYFTTITGSGQGTSTVIWNFQENDAKRQGIGLEQQLLIVFPITGGIDVEVYVNAKIVSTGLMGAISAIRHAFAKDEHRRNFSFQIPSK